MGGVQDADYPRCGDLISCNGRAFGDDVVHEGMLNVVHISAVVHTYVFTCLGKADKPGCVIH